MTDTGPPVMLLSTVDEASRLVLDEELRGRYGRDYEVVTCQTYEHARAVLDGLRHWGRDVAMIIACYNPADREGLSFLRRARAVHPSPSGPSS
jgi:thioredoxin reductase (NADPH)